MVTSNEDYNKYVLDDLKNHKGLLHPVKAHLYERVKAKMVKPEILHPNPEDEFSMEKIGPNWEIVGNYERTIRRNFKVGQDLFDEPLMGVKLDKGGYMLLNGHHRWLASLRVQVPSKFNKSKYVRPKVPLKVVNITTEEDIHDVINKSDRNKCVTIDLDEVLLTDEPVKGITKNIYKSNIRENTSLLIRECQRMGYDVWVYTGSYLSDLYIDGLFKINHCKVDGIVNGINGKRHSNNLKNIFRSKYKYIIHIDNNMISSVNTSSREYEVVDIASGDAWASAAVDAIKQLKI